MPDSDRVPTLPSRALVRLRSRPAEPRPRRDPGRRSRGGGSSPRRTTSSEERPPLATVSPMLKLVLPKGSLESATMDLFEAADLRVRRDSSVTYKATIDDPRIDEVRILRPQEIPSYVAEGLFDIGITGRDWVEETSSEVVTLGELRYSKATSDPIRMVVAVAGDSPVGHVSELGDGVRVSSEYP